MAAWLVPLGVIAVMVTCNALFVAAEFATVGSRRSRVQEDAERGGARAGRLLAIMEDPSQLDAYVAACQIGITLSSLVAGAYGQAQLTPLLEPVLGDVAGRGAAVAIVLVAITTLQVVLGELLPKTVALRYPERVALATLSPMRLSRWLFRPLVVVFNGSAFWLMGRFGLRVDHSHAHVHSPEELAGLYRASAAGGLIDASERDMLAGILNVDQRLAREIMTPRMRMATVRADEEVGAALAGVIDEPHTRFPVVGDDDVIGVAHLRDLFAQAERDPSLPVAEVMRPVVVVAETATVPSLWRTLRDERRHLALVVNEYGDVAGMVTLEDAVEEIFGEVDDEFDPPDDSILVADGRVSVRGDVLLDVIADRFEVAVAEEAVETVGGLVWHLLGRAPAVGDEVALAEGVALRVDEVDGLTVARASFAEGEAGAGAEGGADG